MKRWTLDNLPWSIFEPERVPANLLAQAKGAALVESNAADYVTYLRQVFAGDSEILTDIEIWGEEERLHGAALRRWCEIADPAYDYEASMARFKRAYHLPEGVDGSTRGDKARELVARCVVETGTTTFYTALRDSSPEPLFKEICRRIAADEVRHFNLFLRHLNGHYVASEGIGVFGRLKTILTRVLEVEDPELTFAYFAANQGDDFDPTKFSAYSRQYMAETVNLYQSRHFQASVPLLSRAAGLPVQPWMSASIGKIIHAAFRFKYLRGATANANPRAH